MWSLRALSGLGTLLGALAGDARVVAELVELTSSSTMKLPALPFRPASTSILNSRFVQPVESVPDLASRLGSLPTRTLLLSPSPPHFPNPDRRAVERNELRLPWLGDALEQWTIEPHRGLPLFTKLRTGHVPHLQPVAAFVTSSFKRAACLLRCLTGLVSLDTRPGPLRH